MYRMFALDHYDALILSGEYQKDQARQLEELRNEPAKDIELCGLPFMDVLKKRLEAAGPVPEHEKTILLAPTWGENGLLNRYGERFIDAPHRDGVQDNRKTASSVLYNRKGNDGPSYGEVC